MNESYSRIARVIIGLIVIAILASIVWGWYGDYRAAKSGPETTQTVAPPAAPAVNDPSSESPAVAPAAQESASEARKTVVVQVDGLNLRAEPDSTSKRLAGLKMGQRLTLIKAEGAWLQVTTEDGKTGWVSSSSQYTKIED